MSEQTGTRMFQQHPSRMQKKTVGSFTIEASKTQREREREREIHEHEPERNRTRVYYIHVRFVRS